MFGPKWEEILETLLSKKDINAFPLVSPDAREREDNVVYTLITDGVYSGYEGEFTDNILVSIDARSVDYTTARDLLRDTFDALEVKGRNRSRFIIDREPLRIEYDSTTRIYRFIVNTFLNPYYQIRPDTPLGARSFSPAFSPAFA